MAPVTSLTTEQLRSQTIFQARLDLRWSQFATHPGTLDHRRPQSARLLPGGQYLVCIYKTGIIRLKTLERDSSNAYRLSDFLVKVEGEDLGAGDKIRLATLFSTPEFPQLLVFTVYKHGGASWYVFLASYTSEN